MRRRLLLAVVSSSLVIPGVVACGGGDGDGGGDGSTTPTTITVVSGNGQTGEVGTQLPTALTVRVTDAAGRSVGAVDQYGNALPGKVATWSSSNPAIAPVSASGVLQAWGTGEVTVGGQEAVFDWTFDRCEDYDVPDGPARFVRAGDGNRVLFSGNAPGSYENVEWTWSVYREGSSWHALVHNEFHDAVAPTCQPGNPWPGNPCWYNSITCAVSTDGAKSFSKPGAPAHTVAPAPDAWVPPAPGVVPVGNGFAEGYFEPRNIVRGQHGYYYAFLKAIPTKNWTAAQGPCVFRTAGRPDPLEPAPAAGRSVAAVVSRGPHAAGRARARARAVSRAGRSRRHDGQFREGGADAVCLLHAIQRRRARPRPGAGAADADAGELVRCARSRNTRPKPR